MNIRKLALAAVIGIMICLYLFAGGQKYLDIDIYRNLFQQSPWLTGGLFFMLFVLGTGCSLPVTLIFSYAGSQLGSIEELNLGSILSPGLILSLCLLAGFPFLAKALLKLTRKMLGKTPANRV